MAREGATDAIYLPLIGNPVRTQGTVPGGTVPIVAGKPISGAPLCADHDPVKWHGLWNEAEGCHYDHEHKEDPHSADSVFGPVGAWHTGQELSYPWQTFMGAGEGYPDPKEPGTYENDMKHQGYGWLVGRNIDCGIVQGNECITDFRVQYHAIMASMGATTRFHSYSAEVRLCKGAQCGILRTGGWADYNILTIDDVHVSLSSDPNPIPTLVDRRRDHRTSENTAKNAAWYGRQQNGLFAFVGLDGETWGLVTPDDPFKQHLFCPDFRCPYNGSRMSMHVLSFQVPPAWDSLDGKKDGVITYRGHTDRHGRLVTQGCSIPGLDCVPLILEGVPVADYGYRDDSHRVKRADHDVSPPGEHWIKFPN